MLLLDQGWTAAATAEALDRDPHTIGRWVSAFGEGGPAALIFEQTGGPPLPLTKRSRRSYRQRSRNRPAHRASIWPTGIGRQCVSLPGTGSASG